MLSVSDIGSSGELMCTVRSFLTLDRGAASVGFGEDRTMNQLIARALENEEVPLI